MPPHSKKLKRNGPSPSPTSNAAAGTADGDGIAALEAPNTNAADKNIVDLLDDIDHTPTISRVNSKLTARILLSGMSNKLTARILGFLCYKDIMRSRICCKKFRDAARTTIVPWANYDHNTSYSRAKESQVCVDSKKKYKAMVAMTTALPNLQQLSICDLGHGNRRKYCDGDEPDEERAAATVKYFARNVQIISKFGQLRRLEISADTMLNGKYPALFKFPLLEILSIVNCSYLKWDLEMLAGLPSLKELYIGRSCKYLTGNFRSLSKLKNTLERVHLYSSTIEGNFADLADFPRLKTLGLEGCSLVTGDIREIGENDFASLEDLDLPSSVIGVGAQDFQRISDVPSVAEAIYRLNQRNPPLVKSLEYISWRLSRDSPEWYASSGERGHPPPPFSIDFVQAGSRVGWRWKGTAPYNRCSNSCEINWLGPEPDRESSDYEWYDQRLQSLQEDVFCFEGYHQPPSEDDYKRLCEEYYDI